MLHVLCQRLPGHRQHHPQLQVTGGREHVRQGVRSPTRLQRSIVVHVSDLRRCDVLEVIGQGVGHPPPLEEPAFKVNLLSFCQAGRDVDMMTAEQASDKKSQAEFQCLKFKLQAECTMFQAHQLWRNGNAPQQVPGRNASRRSTSWWRQPQRSIATFDFRFCSSWRRTRLPATHFVFPHRINNVSMSCSAGTHPGGGCRARCLSPHR